MHRGGVPDYHESMESHRRPSETRTWTSRSPSSTPTSATGCVRCTDRWLQSALTSTRPSSERRRLPARCAALADVDAAACGRGPAAGMRQSGCGTAQCDFATDGDPRRGRRPLPARVQSWRGLRAATGYGTPKGIGRLNCLKLGYPWKDFDIASRFARKALRSMSSDRVTLAVQRVYEADNRLVTGAVRRRQAVLTDPALNDWRRTVYGLWNADGMVPPPYLGKTFPDSTTHLLTSGSTASTPKTSR
jgi:hypothetical protein